MYLAYHSVMKLIGIVTVWTPPADIIIFKLTSDSFLHLHLVRELSQAAEQQPEMLSLDSAPLLASSPLWPSWELAEHRTLRHLQRCCRRTRRWEKVEKDTLFSRRYLSPIHIDINHGSERNRIVTSSPPASSTEPVEEGGTSFFAR